MLRNGWHIGILSNSLTKLKRGLLTPTMCVQSTNAAFPLGQTLDMESFCWGSRWRISSLLLLPAKVDLRSSQLQPGEIWATSDMSRSLQYITLWCHDQHGLVRKTWLGWWKNEERADTQTRKLGLDGVCPLWWRAVFIMQSWRSRGGTGFGRRSLWTS